MIKKSSSLTTVSSLIETHFLEEHTRQIFESDRLSNFKAYNNTAHWLKSKMLEYGLDEVEIENVPADGKTLLSDWIAPLAWDIDEGFLDIAFSDGIEQRICDYKTLADSIIMGSKGTGKDVIAAELIDVDGLDLTKEKITGKLAITSKKGCDMKRLVFNAGGVGLVSCYHPLKKDDEKSVFWNNCWSDRRGSWWQIARDCQILGFSVSPFVGNGIKKKLASGEKITIKANVDARIYEGVLPFVTGRIKGSEAEEEEILVLSHLYEHGAHDNASGSATNLEIARSIAAGVARGDIERPKRSLRFLFMAECYGTIAYAQYRKERMKRTKAAISLDGVGAAWPLNIHREPDVSRSAFAPAMFGIAKSYFDDGEDIKLCGVEVSDTMLSDPMIGVSTVWPHRACIEKTWHTSLDDLSMVDFNAMKDMATVVSTTLLDFASFDCDAAARAASQCTEHCVEVLKKKALTASKAVLEYERDVELKAIERLSEFSFQSNEFEILKCLKQAKKTFLNRCNQIIQGSNDLDSGFETQLALMPTEGECTAETIFKRELTGHPSLDPLKDEDYFNSKINPRWVAWQISAFWLVDGKRSFADIYREIYFEYKSSLESLVDYFLVMKKHGYIFTQS